MGVVKLLDEELVYYPTTMMYKWARAGGSSNAKAGEIFLRIVPELRDMRQRKWLVTENGLVLDPNPNLPGTYARMRPSRRNGPSDNVWASGRDTVGYVEEVKNVYGQKDHRKEFGVRIAMDSDGVIHIDLGDQFIEADEIEASLASVHIPTEQEAFDAFKILVRFLRMGVK